MTDKYLRPMVHIRKLNMLVLMMLLLHGPLAGQDSQGDPGDYRAGEKSFQELVNANGESCVECHYFAEPDTINWNPSAMDLSGRVAIYKKEGMGKYFSGPEGELMKKVHAEIELQVSRKEKLLPIWIICKPFLSFPRYL